MGFVQGEGRMQGTLFPVTLEELIPNDHVCRVIDAFVGRLDMAGLGFERAEAAETGRPGYECPRFHEGIFSFIFGRSTEFRNSLDWAAFLVFVFRLAKERKRTSAAKPASIAGSYGTTEQPAEKQ